MIRLATGADIPAAGENEMLLRIRALYRAYGDGCAFLRFFTDDAGAFLSVMDGFAVLYAPHGVNEEWLCFLSMQEEIRTVRTAPAAAQRLARAWNVPYKTGTVMRFVGECSLPTADLQPPDPRRHYALLCRSFNTMPPFDGWYVDVSHRLRHGLAHIASITREGEPVSTAMTVAETETAVLLGAVATAPERRGEGLAGRCVLTLASQFPGREVFLSPVDEHAERIYTRLGFVPVGEWAEIAR